MIIQTEANLIKLSPNEVAPHWNDFHKRFYVYGYRFIKTKQQFSSVSLLHNFKEFSVKEA